jgi:hypothetical protein
METEEIKIEVEGKPAIEPAIESAPIPIPFLLGPSRGYLASCEKKPSNLKQAHSAALRYLKRR